MRRFATHLLDPVADDDIRMALQPFLHTGWPVLTSDGPATVTMTPDAVEAIVAVCLGDPFLFQLTGQHAWDAATTATITRDDVTNGWQHARGEARRHVERLIDALPDQERAILQAMAALPHDERTPTAIAKALGFTTASQIGTATRRLDTTRGIIARTKPYTFRTRTVESYLTSPWP